MASRMTSVNKTMYFPRVAEFPGSLRHNTPGCVHYTRVDSNNGVVRAATIPANHLSKHYLSQIFQTVAVIVPQ